MDNKDRLKQGLEVLLVFVWVLVTIMTCSAIWSFVSNPTFIVTAALLFGFNTVAVIKAAKKINERFK